MAFPATISHQGAIQGAPAASSYGSPSLMEFMNTSFQGTYGQSKGARISIVGATSGAPAILALEGIVKVRMLALSVRSGTIEIRVTSAKGTDQAFSCSGILIWHAPFAGDELTAIKFIGTADLEYVIAGDVS